MTGKTTITTFLAGLAGVLVLAGTAAADPAQSKALVDAAKSQGIVGEQANGYLGYVQPTSDPALKAAVAEINAGRAALYREAAARNNVTPEAAGASAYKAVVEAKVKPGEYYTTPDGAWVRK